MTATAPSIILPLHFSQVLEIVKQLGIVERQKLLLLLLGRPAESLDKIPNQVSDDQNLTAGESVEKPDSLLFQLPAEEKTRLSKALRASVAAEEWKNLSQNLPDVPEISMEEIVAEVKAVRKMLAENKN